MEKPPYNWTVSTVDRDFDRDFPTLFRGELVFWRYYQGDGGIMVEIKNKGVYFPRVLSVLKPATAIQIAKWKIHDKS